MRYLSFVFVIFAFLFFASQNISAQNNSINTELQSELLKMDSLDQAVRKDFDYVLQTYGLESQEVKDLIDKMKAVDTVNTKRLCEIVDEFGWPGRTLVGPAANHSAWIILQHSDTLTQGKYLPLLKTSVDNNESSLTDYAYLLDRVLLGRKIPQMYGTQIIMGDKGEYELYPVEDESNLNKRRKEAGLEPIEDYLEYFNIEYKVKQNE